MKNNIVIKFVIGGCVTIAASLMLLYYFRKKKLFDYTFERSRKEPSSKKQTKSAERSLSKKRGRIQTPRRVISSKPVLHTKKSIDSVKTKYATSDETSSDSLTKQDISSVSKKIRDYSPSSYVETLEGSASPAFLAEKGRIQYSSENYPPAIIWKHKELPKVLLSSEKSEGLQDKKMLASDAKKLSPIKLSTAERSDKSKSVESVGVTKLPIPEEASSPTEMIPIDSYCYCGQDVTISPSTTGELNENCKVELLPTIVKPVSFDLYSPEDLTQVEGVSDEMSKNSMQMNAKLKNHPIIVPFLPILHAITYATEHGQLLQELLKNYEYFEPQFT
ncbi:hypothetical protein ACH3XW_40055 [Acanthocheilonema viteae]